LRPNCRRYIFQRRNEYLMYLDKNMFVCFIIYLYKNTIMLNTEWWVVLPDSKIDSKDCEWFYNLPPNVLLKSICLTVWRAIVIVSLIYNFILKSSGGHGGGDILDTCRNFGLVIKDSYPFSWISNTFREETCVKIFIVSIIFNIILATLLLMTFPCFW